jgi:heme exporter protein A
MAVQLTDVSVRYGSHWALTRVSIQLPQNTKILLLGENGAGKTTLLRVLATTLKPTFGDLNLWGFSSQQHLPALRARIGLMTHFHHHYEALTALENLRFFQKLKGAFLSDTELLAMLEQMRLSAHAHRKVGEFSAGMKKRLSMARLLLNKPDLVLLDEPFGQLDPAGVELMTQMIKRLHQQGATLVIATHDIERGRDLCNREITLSNGRLVAKASMQVAS